MTAVATDAQAGPSSAEVTPAATATSPAVAGAPATGDAVAPAASGDAVVAAGGAPAAHEDAPPVDGAQAPEAGAAVIVDHGPDAEATPDGGPDAVDLAPTEGRRGDPAAPPPGAAAPAGARDLGSARTEVAQGAAAGGNAAADTEGPAPGRLAPPRTLTVDLGSEGLGPLQLVARADGDAVHLLVRAGDQDTRDALHQQRHRLRDDLESAGVPVGDLDVEQGPQRDGADARSTHRHPDPSDAGGTGRDAPSPGPSRAATTTPPTSGHRAAAGRAIDVHL